MDAVDAERLNQCGVVVQLLRDLGQLRTKLGDLLGRLVDHLELCLDLAAAEDAARHNVVGGCKPPLDALPCVVGHGLDALPDGIRLQAGRCALAVQFLDLTVEPVDLRFQGLHFGRCCFASRQPVCHPFVVLDLLLCRVVPLYHILHRSNLAVQLGDLLERGSLSLGSRLDVGLDLLERCLSSRKPRGKVGEEP